MAVSLTAGRFQTTCAAAAALLAACTVVLAPAAANGVADERAVVRAWAEARDRLEAAVAAEETRNGPQSRSLLDPLVSLAVLHQEHGEHALAAEAYARALHVLRVNEGLYTLEQAPLLLQLHASTVARGDDAGAALLDDKLTRLARLHTGDLRTVPILRALADRQLAAYERYLERDLFAPQMNVFAGSWDAPSPFARPMSPMSGPQFWLAEARRNYGAALHAIFTNGETAHPDVPALERALIRSYYLTGLDCALGRDGYVRLVVYYANATGKALDVARALVELADLEWRCGRDEQALTRYEQAYDLLVASDVPDDAIRELFPTDRPVLLPTFIASPFAEAGGSGSSEAIDVRFDITKYGSARRVVFDAADLTPEMKRRVRRDIETGRYRPPLTGGRVEERASYRVSYVDR